MKKLSDEDRKQRNRERQRKFHAKHREEQNLKRKLRRLAHLEEEKASAHIRYIANKRTEYHLARRAKQLERERQKHHEYFELVVNHYGGKCVCCGETTHIFLTVDHIDGGGRKHRRQISNKLYRWLVLNNYPSGFQIMCFNCNCGKYRNHGVCPHKEIKVCNLHTQ